jgi:ferrochelatase
VDHPEPLHPAVSPGEDGTQVRGHLEAGRLALRVYTLRQAQLLRGYLGERVAKPVPVVAAMRYGNPSIAQGVKELEERGCVRLLVLPMYPQFAGSTTESARERLTTGVEEMAPGARREVRERLPAHPAYVKAIARNVNEYWMKHGRPDRLLMSFHGLPRAVVEAGDPYADQCRESARLIATELGWNDQRTRVTFQSRFRAPGVGEALYDPDARELGREGVAAWT